MDNRHQDIKLNDNKHISSDTFIRLVVGSLQDYAIFTTDKDLLINCWCAGSTKLFGYKSNEVIGRPSEIIYTEEDKNNNIPCLEMENALKEGKASNNRWHVTRDGSLFYAYEQMFPLKDTNENLIGFVKILRDLTEKKIAEDAINKHMKELEDLITHKENILAILSHDLRSPLAAIIEISDHLKSNIDEMNHADIKQMLDILYQASTDELNMLDYLLEWARIKYASEVFSPSMLDLSNYIRKAFNIFSEHAAVNNISLQNEVPGGTAVFADKKMLLSILQNLVSNALKHSLPMGIINVSAIIQDGKILVKVEDTGTGMPKEKLEKLFKPQLKPLSNL
ncbi:MAG: PAS domain-containing sensor histidine kinase, partial [Verrucomicrobia bacterium]|nr:PAS domain-containing sensor histidine kinase [Prolixibacteraceae bacterium]